MTPVVVDTDVVPFLFKNDSRAQPYLPLMRNRDLLDLILQWAGVMVAARANGRRIEAADAWIAATALLYGAALVTHNPKDYLDLSNLSVLGVGHGSWRRAAAARKGERW
jgi:hypothetical protein